MQPVLWDYMELGKAGHSIRFIRKYGSSATHNFAVVDGASPHGQSRLGGFVATYI